jgi:hypothetical protein
MCQAWKFNHGIKFRAKFQVVLEVHADDPAFKNAEAFDRFEVGAAPVAEGGTSADARELKSARPGRTTWG